MQATPWSLRLLPVGLTLLGACSQPRPAFPDALEDDVGDTDASEAMAPDTATTGGTPGSAPDPATSTTAAPGTPDDEPVGDTDGSTGIDQGGGGGSTGDEDLGCTGSCTAVAPSGWNGPYAVKLLPGVDDSPTCPDPYPELRQVAWGGFSGPAADCECDCGAPVNARCEGRVRVRQRGIIGLNSYACYDTIGGPYDLDDGDVVDLVDMSSSPVTGWQADYLQTPHVEGGSCAPQASGNVEPAGFGSTTFACSAGFDALGCDDGQWCMPDLPPNAQMCIVKEGDHPCPTDGDYTDRRQVHEDFTDNRYCTTCSCGSPAGVCDDPSTSVLSTHLDRADLTEGSTCDMVWPAELSNRNISGLTFDAGTPDAACQPIGGNAAGAATPTDPITICCMP